jgi:hypothetical protein
MKKVFLLTLILFVLFLVSSILISCTQAVTKTVFVTDTQEKNKVSTPVTRTLTVENTVTTVKQGNPTTTVLPLTTTPVFDREPPEIPHSLFFSMPGVPYLPGEKPLCFECHNIPPLHEGWLLDTELCDECHPISDMPYLDEG